MKWKDEIVDEIRKQREDYAKSLLYDAKKIAEDIKRKEKKLPINHSMKHGKQKPQSVVGSK
jgi:histone H3/H4